MLQSMPIEESARETIEPHLAKGETPQAINTDEGRVVVVTDRRVIQARERTVDGSDVQDVESILLRGPHVLGTRVKRRDAGEPRYGQVGLGVLFAVIGALLAYGGVVKGWLGFALPQSSGTVILLAGVVAVPSGAYLVYEGMQTDPARIEVNVLSTGNDKTLELPQSASDIAETVSSVVATDAA